VDRIKKLSLEILKNYKIDFGIDFKDNKKTLERISIIRSKGLKNEIAGYITKYINHEILDKKKKEERIAKQAKLDESQEENLDIVQPKNESSADTKVPQTTS
jgi:small subunit ribosomal protein S17e